MCMQEYLISEYIKKLSIDDIHNFANKKGFSITNSDALILYTYAKKYYQEFLNNPEEIIKELKDKLSPNTFKEAYKLYLEYKIKYLN